MATIDNQVRVYQELKQLGYCKYSWVEFVEQLRFFWPVGAGGIAFHELPAMPGTWTINAWCPRQRPNDTVCEQLFQCCKMIGCKRFLTRYSCWKVKQILKGLHFCESAEHKGWMERVL